MYLKFRIILLFLLFYFPVFGQRLYFERWHHNTILPSQECYNVYQDQKGYIYFSAEQGFCRFDGSTIKVFDRANGLPEGAIYSVVEDKKGRLFLFTSKKRVLILENDRITEPAFSKIYSRLTIDQDVPFSLKLVNDRYLYLNSNEDTYKADILTNAIHKLSPNTKANPYVSAFLTGNQIITVNSFSNSFKAYSECEVKIKGLVTQQKLAFPIKSDKTFNYRYIKSETIGDCYLLVFDTMLIVINRSGKITKHHFSRRILQTHFDKDGGIWLGFEKGGLHYYPDGNLEIKPVLAMQDYSVSGIIEDAEHNIWCTTLERGLFVSKNKNILQYTNIPGLDKPVDMLKQVNGKLFISGTPDELVIIQNDIQKKTLPLYGSSASDIISYDNSYYISANKCIIKTNKDFILQKNFVGQKSQHLLSARSLQIANGNIYSIAYYEFGSLSNSGYTQLIKTPERLRGWQHLEGDQWLMADEGLFTANIKSSKINPIPGINTSVTKIYRDHNNKIWITTKGSGLYQYKAGKVLSVNKTSRINTNVLFDIIEDHEHTIWLGSNKGLIRISNKGKTDYITTLDGLPSNEIYKLAIYQNKLFFSTADGIFSLALSKNTRVSRPEIYFKSLFINSKKARLSSIDKQLEYDQNSLRFSFDALIFKTKPKLLYQLQGRDKAYKTINGNTILEENLAPGVYKLIVFAVNQDNVKSNKPVIINFTINPPFYTTWWFIVLIALVVALLIGFVVFVIIHRIKSKESEKTRINKLLAESRLSALQAQMNPHFIFNAINSIQNYILKKNEKEAYDYLTKFSKLIRLVLNNSTQKLLSLHDELQAISLYIELEQLRFKSSFDFELVMHENVDEFEIQIPTMLIQPFLENAIWHGLMPVSSDKKGKIVLELQVKNDILIVAITDNGVGRKVSADQKNQNTHRPVAMKLVAERIDLVKQLYNSQDIQINVIDLLDQNNRPAGTKIEIKLPVYHE